MIYFLCYPSGDRSKITVIDLSPSVSYERGDWANVNDNTYSSAEAAIAAARDIASRHGLRYVRFKSRYNSETSETGYIY